MGQTSHEREEAAMVTDTRVATIRAAGEGEQRWFCGGGVFTWKATAAETDGAMLVFEDQLEAGKVTPLHLHPDADETFYMLEGEIRLVIAGEKSVLGAGGIAVIPRLVPQPWAVTTPGARRWCVQTRGAARLSTGSPATPSTRPSAWSTSR